MNKRTLNERDMCIKYIAPQLGRAGVGRDAAICEEARFARAASSCAASWSRGVRQAGRRIYFKPDIPLALIEAKGNSHTISDGIQQGLDYAATLDIPFVSSSNGDGFVLDDRTGAKRFDNGTAQPNLSSAGLPLYEIPLPPLPSRTASLIALCDRPDASRNATAVTSRRLLDARLAEALAPGDAHEMEAAE